MREQAKKMNVTSLRSADQANTSAEIKLAKVRITQIYYSIIILYVVGTLAFEKLL